MERSERPVRRWHGLDDVSPGWGRSVVTIGVFDGVHRGHQAVIARAVENARAAGLPVAVVTFDPHPVEVVRPGSHPPVLTSVRHRIELLAQLGVDAVLVLDFTLEFSRLGPEEFVVRVLVDRLHAAAVVVGENFRFGHRAAGDLALLRRLGERYGFTVGGVGMVEGGGDTASGTAASIGGVGTGGNSGPGVGVSSTYVRDRLAAGDVSAATAALGRPHRVEGVVVRGDRRGRQLGYPTANLEAIPHAAVPADGVYAGWLLAGRQRLPAAISVGSNPTFDGTRRSVEAYVLDRDDLDLYGVHVAVEFAARLRGMARFDSTEALVAQMAEDVRRTREALPAG